MSRPPSPRRGSSLPLVQRKGRRWTTDPRTGGRVFALPEPPGVWRYYGRDDSYYPQVKAQFGHPKLPPDMDDTSQAWAALSESGVVVDPGASRSWKGPGRREASPICGLPRPTRSAGWTAANESRIWPSTWMFRSCSLAWDGRTPKSASISSSPSEPESFVAGRCGTLPRSRSPTSSPELTLTGGPHVFVRRLPVSGPMCWSTNSLTGAGGDDVQTALAVLTLLNLGERGEAVRRGIRTVLAQQESDGGWASGPLYRGSVFYYGSRALTTSLCLEALGKYRGLVSGARKAPPASWGSRTFTASAVGE